MFAPEIAKARTKTAESQVNNLARRGSTLVERSFASEVVDQPHMFPARSIDNQTALRLLSQRDFRPTGKGARGDHGQEVEQVSMTARGTTPGVSWNFSKIPIFRPGLENQPEARFLGSAVHLPGIIQPKLAVGRVNDPLEREADRAAEHVMRMPYPVTTSASGDKVLQRKCEACEEEDKEDPSKSTRSTSHDAAAFDGMTAPTSVHEVLRSPGQALEPSTRGFFERRFGHDFSNIRVHTDSLAATSARSVGALAYTVGTDIVFGRNQYIPHADPGVRLLAHELAHTLQQGGTAAVSRGRRASLNPSRVSDCATESEAQIAADAVSGAPSFALKAHAQQISRKEEPTEQASVDEPMQQQASLGGRACVIKEQIPTITVPVAVFDDEVMMQTDVDIEWKDDEIKAPMASFCSCQCGEYRQFVKGHLIRNGAKLDLPLAWGAKLEETVWHEDGDPASNLVYGHRDRPGSAVDVFDRPNRALGCHYHGKDQPRVPGRHGDMIDVDLKFKGQTYDTCLDNWGQIHEWSFTYRGPLGGI